MGEEEETRPAHGGARDSGLLGPFGMFLPIGKRRPIEDRKGVRLEREGRGQIAACRHHRFEIVVDRQHLCVAVMVWNHASRPPKRSITTLASAHGPRQPPMVRCTVLRSRLRSHSLWYSSSGTGSCPRSVRPQQHPLAQTKSCPGRRKTLIALPSARRTRLRGRGAFPSGIAALQRAWENQKHDTRAAK